MYKLTLCYLAFFFLITEASGQTSIGIYNSYKGFGFSLESTRNTQEYRSFSIYADIYGVPQSLHHNPGVKATYTRNIALRIWDKPNVSIGPYFGPGVFLGWVNDRKQDNYGLSAGICGIIGVRFLFVRGIVLDAGIQPEIGFFTTFNRGVKLNFYRNGAVQSVFPHLKLLFPLGR